MKSRNFFAIMAAAAVSLTLCGAEFAKELKLKGVKTPKVSAVLDDGAGNQFPVRLSGKAWGPAQIAGDGSLIRFKADFKQQGSVRLPLKKRSFTVSVWAKADSIADPQSAIMVNTTRPPCWGLVLRNNAKNPDLLIADVFYNWNVPGMSGALIRNKEPMKKSDWHFYTCVCDRENEKFLFYINGKFADSAKLPKAAPEFREYLSVAGGNGFFNGSIRDLRITPSALSAEEIAALYKSTAVAEGK